MRFRLESGIVLRLYTHSRAVLTIGVLSSRRPLQSFSCGYLKTFLNLTLENPALDITYRAEETFTGEPTMTPNPKSQRERELTEEEEYDLFRMEQENGIRAQEEADQWDWEDEKEADACMREKEIRT